MHVLVTRPAPDAGETAARLARMGHRTFLAPVIRIEALAFEPPACGFDAIVVTSANALRAAATALPARDTPIFTAGEHTAEAARASGFTDVRTAAGGAAPLVRAITATRPCPRRVLYLAGTDRKPTLEAGLQAAGIGVLAREVYTAVPVSELPADAADALAGETIDAVVHYSRRSAAIFCQLMAKAGLIDALRNIEHHCISSDCAEPLLAAGARSIVVAATPDEKALLGALSLR